MIKSAASKVMWVGRATVFLVGLAVILALVFGITSTAFAHGGDKGFFHLGHRNVKHAVSKLVGKVVGPSLVIGNGSEDRRATALRLNVKPGKAPMQVNSDAKVRKLNADKLDGKHAENFAAKAEAPGFDAQTGTSTVGLLTSVRDVATVTVTAPADGFVILTGSGNFWAGHSNGTSTEIDAYLTTTSGQANNGNQARQLVPSSAPSGQYVVPFSITRVYPVTAGEHTFYMTAVTNLGGPGYIFRHNLTGVFVKNRL